MVMEDFFSLQQDLARNPLAVVYILDEVYLYQTSLLASPICQVCEPCNVDSCMVL